MPTRHATTLRIARPDPTPHLVTCPSPTSFNANDPGVNGIETKDEQDLNDCAIDDPTASAEDNTAVGMSMMQEASAYIQGPLIQPIAIADGYAFDKDKHMPSDTEAEAEEDTCLADDANSSDYAAPADARVDAAPPSPTPSQNDWASSSTTLVSADAKGANNDHKDDSNAELNARRPDTGAPSTSSEPRRFPAAADPGARPAEVDHGTKSWIFSNVRLSTQYPSSLLHPGSKFEGTQQSDRQIYKVMVDILTVDIPQSTLSGYLRIEGLTPDHPTLTTFFRGEIIGGPNQKYSFQTRHTAWGATDKTDLMHWARFPAWRPLSREARKDLNFEYPAPGSKLEGHDSWWQKDHIFMRWKEEFLVPDHRVRSIQGASFEGFYYICFDQIEGKISGIYFHARSEK